MHDSSTTFPENGNETATRNTRVTVFEPSVSKDPFEEYPELRDIAEFAELTSGEYRFVYHYANRTSDLYEVTPKNVKISKCFDRAFGARASASSKQNYLTEMFPERVVNALARMREINPTVRIRAKSMVEKIFSSYENILSTAQTENMDMGEAGKFVTLTKTITETLPALVEQMEHPYGVKDKKTNEDRNEENVFDQVMKNS